MVRYLWAAAALVWALIPGRETLAQSPLESLHGPIDIWHRDTLTGDWGGLRTALSDRGLAFTASYAGEFFANVQGGNQAGSRL